jgi:hypothetical protein
LFEKTDDLAGKLAGGRSPGSDGYALLAGKQAAIKLREVFDAHSRDAGQLL